MTSKFVPMFEHDIIHFNNCKGRPHAAIYKRPDAFFDLGVTGPQAKLAADLPVGQECVVARYGKDDAIIFEWYALTGVATLPDENDVPNRVFLGDLLFTETMSKANAAATTRYNAFFDVNGHFKRPSVIVGAVARNHRPPRKQVRQTFCPEEVHSFDGPFIEGATRRITVNAYERNAAARTACIQHYGTACCICGADFAARYGPEAAGYIHVHHLRPLSELHSSYEIDPIRDLCPVCPNCHAVLHLGGVTRSIEEVRAMLKSAADGARQAKKPIHARQRSRLG